MAMRPSLTTIDGRAYRYFARPNGEALPGFGYAGRHPHAHNWRAFIELFRDGILYTFSRTPEGAPTEPLLAAEAAPAAAAPKKAKTKSAKKKTSSSRRKEGSSSKSSKSSKTDKKSASGKEKEGEARPPAIRKAQPDMSWVPPKPLLARGGGRETGVKVVTSTI